MQPLGCKVVGVSCTCSPPAASFIWSLPAAPRLWPLLALSQSLFNVPAYFTKTPNSLCSALLGLQACCFHIHLARGDSGSQQDRITDCLCYCYILVTNNNFLDSATPMQDFLSADLKIRLLTMLHTRENFSLVSTFQTKLWHCCRFRFDVKQKNKNKQPSKEMSKKSFIKKPLSEETQYASITHTRKT